MISRKRKTERRVSRGLFRLAAYGLFGVIFALSVTAMLLSGHINFQRFYDVGEICDVREVGGAGVAGLSYSGETNSYQVLDDVASKAYYIQSRENCWNYFYIKIDVLNAPELNVTFLGCDAAGAERFRADYALKDGDNYLAIGGQAFEQCRLAIERQKGTEFRIYKLRFFEKEIAVWGKKAWLIAAAVWVCFMAVGLLLSRKGRVPFVGALDAFIDLWQEIFCICGRGAIDIGKKCSEKGRRLIRVTLFLLFIWGSYYFFITDIYKQNKNLVYLFGGAVSVALAVFCFEKAQKAALAFQAGLFMGDGLGDQHCIRRNCRKKERGVSWDRHAASSELSFFCMAQYGSAKALVGGFHGCHRDQRMAPHIAWICVSSIWNRSALWRD